MIMKKTVSLLFTSCAILIVGLTLTSNSNGVTGTDYTGSPIGLGNCSSCHGNLNANTGITLAGFPSSYTPGSTYNVSLTIDNSSTRHGFQGVSLNSSNLNNGSFTAGTGSKLASINGRQYITHSAAATSNSFSFTWTAPLAGNGDAILYFSANAANGDMGTSGDVVYTTSVTIPEGTTGIQVNNKIASATLFPNPASNRINIVAAANTQNIEIVDLQGRVVKSLTWNQGSENIEVEVAELSNGFYLARIIGGDNANETLRFRLF